MSNELATLLSEVLDSAGCGCCEDSIALSKALKELCERIGVPYSESERGYVRVVVEV